MFGYINEQNSLSLIFETSLKKLFGTITSAEEQTRYSKSFSINLINYHAMIALIYIEKL